MTDEQWLRDALTGSVPEPPPTPDRADASRRRATTARRRGVAAVAATTAVVLAAVLVPVLVSRGGSAAPDPSPQPAPPATTSPAVPCPAAPAPGKTVRASELDSGSSAVDVVAAYLGLLNERDRRAAAALLDQTFGIRPRVPASYERIDFEVKQVRHIRWISSIWDATAVTGRYRVVPEDGSCPEYRKASFMLGRNQAQTYRIVRLTFAEDAPTGD